ncbi:rhodanese-like domain-containing protein [Streptomyces tendae]|uniref:rhodanese-like domain-containing protein n=1 Tax=Streptomyces tendae TaxID=1932 RepID=UPI003CD0D5F8
MRARTTEERRNTLPTGEFSPSRSAASGIDNSSRVVVYDSGGAWATRVWRLCRVFGHNVSVLDGGKRAWTSTPCSTRQLASSSPQRYSAERWIRPVCCCQVVGSHHLPGR